MSSLRFNPPVGWNGTGFNWQYIGFNVLLIELSKIFSDKKDLKMLEIGSYMGESTSMFASTGMFTEIHCIDPFDGYEEANDILGNRWIDVKREFDINTRHFSNITVHQDYSYNIVNLFEDNYFDLIYIDAAHDYASVKADIEMYLPKCKIIMAGHDYSDEWEGVKLAVNETVGVPDIIAWDCSWLKKIK